MTRAFVVMGLLAAIILSVLATTCPRTAGTSTAATPVASPSDSIESERTHLARAVRDRVVVPSADPLTETAIEESRGTSEVAFRVTGDVKGLTAAETAGARIRLEYAGGSVLTGSLAADGRFEIEISRAVEESLLGLDGLDSAAVEAEHPNYCTARIEFRLGSISTRDRGDGTRAWRVGELKMKRCWSVAGEVVVPEGTDLQRVEVGLFHLRDGQPARDPSVSTFCNEAGAFLVQSPTETEVLVVAMEPGSRPACKRIDLRTTLRPFVRLDLVPGAILSGTAFAGREPASPGSIVRAKLEQGQPTLWFRQGPLTFDSDRVERFSVSAIVAAGGHFRLQGLAPRIHRLAIVHLPGTKGWLHAQRASGAGDSLRVQAPAAGVNLAMDSALVRFQLATDGMPMTGEDATATLLLVRTSGHGPGAFSTGKFAEDGTYVLLVDPGTTLTARVGDGPERVFDTPSSGAELSVTMEWFPQKPPEPTPEMLDFEEMVSSGFVGPGDFEEDDW